MELVELKIVSRCFIKYLHFFFLLMIYCVWIIHVRGRCIDLYMFLVSHCLLIYIYEVIHDICLYFVVCEIKKLFLFCLYFPHMRLCVC